MPVIGRIRNFDKKIALQCSRSQSVDKKHLAVIIKLGGVFSCIGRRIAKKASMDAVLPTVRKRLATETALSWHLFKELKAKSPSQIIPKRALSTV